MSSHKELLSTEECKAILSKDLNHNNFTVKSFNISSLSDKIEGFLGEHFLVAVEYDLLEEPLSRFKKRYFMKIVSEASQVVVELTTALNAFAKEEFFYNALLPEMDRNHLDVTFAPKSFICKSNIVVLEDLSIRDYRNLPKNTFFDLKHCKRALDTLAKLHSSGILYQKRLTQSLHHMYPEMLENIFSNKGDGNIVRKWLEHSLEGIFQIIEYIYENDARKNDLITKLKELVENSPSMLENSNKHNCCTILHGDVWSNNFLFKYNEENPTDCVLIDYQILNYGPPSLEVLHLIYCNTRKKLRNNHFSELVDFYYDCLQTKLPEGDGAILSKDEYLRLCKMYKPWIKLQCMCDRSVTFIPDRYVHENVRNDDDFRKYLFEDRAKIILTCFKKEESFRELISEDIEELCDLLLCEQQTF